MTVSLDIFIGENTVHETKMQKQAQRAKMFNIIIFSVFAAIVVTALVGYGVFIYHHTFTVEKWNKEPDDRTNMVADLFEKYELIGLTEEKIISLLGKEENFSNSQTSFKISKTYVDPENTIVYYLGPDFMEVRWLIISLENDVVCSYCIDIT